MARGRTWVPYIRLNVNKKEDIKGDKIYFYL
jgi:hypothetical protein